MQSQTYEFIPVLLKPSFMKQFLLYLKHFSNYKRFNFLIPLIFSMISYFATAQTSGIYESYAILSIKGGSNSYYDMQAITGNPDFNGANLGSFVYGLETLVFKGGENKTYKNSGCNINSSAINYRIYLSGSPLGSYTNVNEPFSSNIGGGGDQKWEGISGSVDVISGLSPGTYTLEVYSQAGYDSCGAGTHYSSNGGANYKATFNVVKAESTISVTGTTSFSYDNTPKGPSTAIVLGSTGAITYSYAGISPTIYAVNALPPTNPGTYTVTATVSPDDNYNEASSSVTPFTIDAGLYTYIPDANFLQALIDPATYNVTNLGDCVLTSEITSVTILNIMDKNITSLVGIEDFASLEELYCSNEIVGDGNDNAITTLDVSGFPNMIRLYCQNNQITTLNIAGLTKLEALDTSNNPFIATTLDVHLNPNLYYLLCQNNGLTDLNISGLTNLVTLVVWDNSLTSIDLSANPNINYLDCDENLFTSLDVSNLVNLNQFYCSGNSLTSIDVRGLNNLDRFYCSNNPLTCILVDDVAAAVLKTTTADPDPQGDGSFLWATDTVSLYSYCKCDLTTTWNGNSWDNGAPTTGTYAAIIAGDYNQSVNINACSLTVTSNAIVSIPSGYNVTLNAPIIVTSGSSFTLSNTANLIQTNKNSVNSGTINVNRNSNSLQRKDYTLWSSPVAGQKLAAFSPLTSLDPNRFYIYNSASNEYTNTAPAVLNPTATNFSPGAGYLIRMPNENPAILGTLSDYYLGNAAITYNGVFTGIPNNGDVPVALSTAGAGAYNLVGNPYPSTINLFTLQSDNAAVIGNTFYMWRKTNGLGTAYCSYVPTSAIAGTYVSNTNTQSPATFVGDIQAGQGFFVSALTTGPLVFKNGQRVTTASSFFKTKQIAASSKLWLNVTNVAGDFSQMAVTYFDGATPSIDAFDGKYINDSAFALTSNVNNGEYTIQGRPAFDVADVVALNFKTELAGDYTIAIDHLEGVFASGQDIYLVDSKTGTETNLTTSAYNFNAIAGVDNTRFSLKYQKTLKVDDAIFNENNVTIYAKNGSLYISSGEMAINTIQVYDVQGRLIAERKNVKATTATLENLKANNQVLLVKVSGENNQVVTKKVVN